MATIKSYTDISQSKRLAEFLPIGSVDMYYDVDSYGVRTTPEVLITSVVRKKDIPCWSLAALLEQLPEIINYEDDESDYALEISKENDLYYLSYGNPFEHDKLEVEPQDNFVDACYEMIIKLYKRKLL